MSPHKPAYYERQLRNPTLCVRGSTHLVKSFLDFLEEEGFEVEEIANKPRVLTASQKTVEQRLKKLRKLGLSEINLNVLCRSRKDFKKYCESIESVVNASVTSGNDK